MSRKRRGRHRSEPKVYTGKDLIDMGFNPGIYFGEALRTINTPKGMNIKKAFNTVKKIYLNSLPKIVDPASKSIINHLSPEGGRYEKENYDKVSATVENLLKHPKVKSLEVMSDACPSGDINTIPVGVIASVEGAIIPDMHSADIACSLMTSYIDVKLDDGNSKEMIDRFIDSIYNVGTFGKSQNPLFWEKDLNAELRKEISNNIYLKDFLKIAEEDLGSQGDGNHFLTCGQSKKTNRLVIVSHHGSRRLGSMLYKQGKAIARKMSGLSRNAYIPLNTVEAVEYLNALKTVYKWTYRNHMLIHNMVAEYTAQVITDQYFNSHNMIYRDPKNKDLIYHAKGATPLFQGYPEESFFKTIPVNMKDPILLVNRDKSKENLFAPHGAGRNISRSQFLKDNEGNLEELFNSEVSLNLEYIPYLGEPDYSELPSAYKDFNYTKQEVGKLCNIVDEIIPKVSMMAGKEKSKIIELTT